VSAAKAYALAWNVPFVGVNHLEAHVYAAGLEDPSVTYPHVCLMVSGGHTLLINVKARGEYQVLGSTIDDAVGEAFDKVARYLGLGYPGGPALDREAMNGDAAAIHFTRPMLGDGYDFSFSGIKSAVVRHVKANPDLNTADIAAGFQAAVVDVLVAKVRKAATEYGATGIVLAGGVAANSLLRERVLDVCIADHIQAWLPGRDYCTDNAAMVAAAGHFVLLETGAWSLGTGANPSLAFPGLRA
jgi:N6-L-threonylcarbamoyladenine synthase